jgi:hypothetical protein
MRAIAVFALALATSSTALASQFPQDLMSNPGSGVGVLSQFEMSGRASDGQRTLVVFGGVGCWTAW